jgi:hypothetical protein
MHEIVPNKRSVCQVECEFFQEHWDRHFEPMKEVTARMKAKNRLVEEATASFE